MKIQPGDRKSTGRGGEADNVEPIGTKDLSRKRGGWKTMPFILGNETCERLASFSVQTNFMVYLTRMYHMDQVSASNISYIWSGVSNFAPLLGAFLSDSYFGRFNVIAFSSFAGFAGMLILTLTAWIPSLRPKACPSPVSGPTTCTPRPNSAQLGVLILGLGLLSVATGGIRPCSIPFGVDQFDLTTEHGRRATASYYNWYYATYSAVIVVALTVIVYVQESISWVVGYGIPTALMLCSIFVFFFGSRRYVRVAPEGSVFSGIAEAAVAAFRKRRLLDGGGEAAAYYDPPSEGPGPKLPLTNQYRCLNKGAIVEEGDLNPDGGRSSKWRLSSVQQIEEAKCLVKVLPMCASGIIAFVAPAQQFTFTVAQALAMDRHIPAGGTGFEVPAGSMTAVAMVTVAVWVPVYDRLVVPALAKVTGHKQGLSLLQRMGIGLVMSVVAMVVAGLMEKQRRDWTLATHKPQPVFWLAPQLVLMGLAEAFSCIAQIEFYNKEFPDKMSSMATSLFFCTIGGANYVSSLITTLVHDFSGHGSGRLDWLDSRLDQGRLDYFYYLLAALEVVNLAYFFAVSRKYRYKVVHFQDARSASVGIV